MKWGEEFHTLSRNFLPEPHCIHGHGWQRPWELADITTDTIRMFFDFAGSREGEGWPWSYRATQSFTLHDAGVCITLSVENLSDTPMPAGLGLHPYFPRSAATRVRASVTHRWERGPDMVPIAPVETQPDPIVPPADGGLLDHGFAGWSGTAEITDEVGTTMMTADPSVFGHLVVFTPEGEDHLCVEPVSHAINGVNLAPYEGLDHGIRTLGPGETLAGWVRIDRIVG